MFDVWQALGFMTLGGLIVEMFNIRIWRAYNTGKKETHDLYKR